jgi:DNA-directed RNA polymerase specialized sigma24 family protein
MIHQIRELTDVELETLRRTRPKMHALWLLVHGGMTYGAAAAELGISIGTAKSRIHRARAHVAKWRAQEDARRAAA